MIRNHDFPNTPDMKITVIVPTFNRVARLERSLRSVEIQTLAPWEVIVVDDGSTDSTESMVRQRFPHVRYLRQAHRGVSRARNLGIIAARSEWLAFLDSDDEWFPHKLERQCEALTQQRCFRLCHTDEIWIRNGRRVNPMKKHAKAGGEIFTRCLPRCVISPSSVIVHRSLFDQLGGFDETLPVCEDYDLWLRICSAYPVLFLSDYLIIKYGGHADQLSRQLWGMDRFRIQALEKLFANDKLSSDDRVATLRELLHKITIVLQGARKRNNRAVATAYMEKRARYQRLWHQTLCDHALRPGAITLGE